MVQSFLIIMRTTNLTNLTEEYVSRLSYYTQESNKRLSPHLLPPFLPPFLTYFHCCCCFGYKVFPPQGKYIFASLYTILSNISLLGYLQQVILMPPLFSPGSHILFMLMNIYSEQHLWSIFLSSLTFAEKNKQEARRANCATERARTL